MTDRRWCSAGASARPDAADAAQEAVRTALEAAARQRSGPPGADPSDTAADTGATAALAGDAALAVVFASSAHDLAEVARGLRSVLPQGVPLVGCTTSGEIAGSSSSSSGLALMLFGGDGFDVRVTSEQGLDADSAGAGERLARRLYDGEDSGPSTHPNDVVLLLTDGLAGDQQALVTGVYRVTGAAIPLVGGCAGDDLAMAGTHQLVGGPDGDHVLHDAVVGVRLRSSGPVGIGVHHGWTRVGEPLVVTGVDGVRVLSLDDEPALDAYLRVLGAPPEVHDDPAAFTRFALDHPLGIVGRRQDLVRFVPGADFENRSLTLIAPVPQGGLVWLMAGDVESVLAATDEACRLAVAQLDGRPVRGAIAFDCVARRAVLGASTQDEVDRIAEQTDGAPVIGFYTYGEIARTRGMSGFHNQTLVVLAVS